MIKILSYDVPCLWKLFENYIELADKAMMNEGGFHFRALLFGALYLYW